MADTQATAAGKGPWEEPMTVKTHKTAVVLIPPQERWEPIQTIRRGHDRHLRRWMPHVTLIYPFRPRKQFDEVEPILREACGRIAAFEVRLAEFRHFDHGRERFTLWLAPEPRGSLVALQTALESAVPGCDDVSGHPDGFTPHLSVGQVSGHDAMAAAGIVPTLTEGVFNIRRCRALHQHAHIMRCFPAVRVPVRVFGSMPGAVPPGVGDIKRTDNGFTFPGLLKHTNFW